MSATVLAGFLLSFTAIAYAGIPVWVQYISNITGFILAASLLLPRGWQEITGAIWKPMFASNARRDEGAYLNKYVTEEQQRSRRKDGLPRRGWPILTWLVAYPRLRTIQVRRTAVRLEPSQNRLSQIAPVISCQPLIRGHAFPRTPLDKWIVLYALWFALSFICSGHKYVSRLEFFNLLTGLAVFYTAVGIGSSESGQKRLKATLILLGIFVISANLWPNVSYLMLNPNIVAGYLVAILPVFTGVVLAEPRYVKIFGLIATGLGVTLLLLTGSIWGLISLFGALFVVLYIQKCNVKILLVLFLFILASMFAIELLPFSSITDRLKWWEAGIKALWNNAVLGLGPGVFSEAYRGFAGKVSQHSLYAHNYFIQLAAETGLPGLILWLFVILNWFRWFLSQKLTSAQVGTFIGVLALLIHNLADYSLNLSAHGLLFWFLLGSFCPSVHVREPRRIPAIFRMFLLIILVSYGTRLGQLFASWHKLNAAKIEVASSLVKAQRLAHQAIKLDKVSPEGYALLARIEIEYYKQDGMVSHLYRAANFLGEALARSPYSLELKRDLRQVQSLLT